MGAGCTQKNYATQSNPRGSVSGNGEDIPGPVETPQGVKYYTSITKEVCEMKEMAQTCEMAGAQFFKDDKGCGCISPK